MRDTLYSPVAGASFDGFVETPSGERASISGTTGDAGESQVVFTPTEQGTHQIQVYYGDQTAKRFSQRPQESQNFLNFRAGLLC